MDIGKVHATRDVALADGVAHVPASLRPAAQASAAVGRALMPSRRASTTPRAPCFALLTLGLPEGRRSELSLGLRSFRERVKMSVYSEVARPRPPFTLPGDMYDKGVERWKVPLRTSVVELLHECGDEMGLTADVQILRRRQACGLEDS